MQLVRTDCHPVLIAYLPVSRAHCAGYSAVENAALDVARGWGYAGVGGVIRRERGDGHCTEPGNSEGVSQLVSSLGGADLVLWHLRLTREWSTAWTDYYRLHAQVCIQVRSNGVLRTKCCIRSVRRRACCLATHNCVVVNGQSGDLKGDQEGHGRSEDEADARHGDAQVRKVHGVRTTSLV